jgi:hypothetical protein
MDIICGSGEEHITTKRPHWQLLSVLCRSLPVNLRLLTLTSPPAGGG